MKGKFNYFGTNKRQIGIIRFTTCRPGRDSDSKNPEIDEKD